VSNQDPNVVSRQVVTVEPGRTKAVVVDLQPLKEAARGPKPVGANLSQYVAVSGAELRVARGSAAAKVVGTAASAPASLRLVIERARMQGVETNLPVNMAQFLGLADDKDSEDLPVKKLKDETTGKKRIFEVSLRHMDAAIVVLYEGNEVYFYRTDSTGAQLCTPVAGGNPICGAKWVKDKKVIIPYNDSELFEAEKRFWISRYDPSLKR
jgi:hypothetical protein